MHNRTDGTPTSLPPEVARFPERLKQAIGDTSVRAFAQRCGLAQATLASYLNGDTYPTLDRLATLADAAHVPIIWFLGDDTVQTGAGGEPQPMPPPFKAETLKRALMLLRSAHTLAGIEYTPESMPELLISTYEFLSRNGMETSLEDLAELSKQVAYKRAKDKNKDSIDT